MADRAAEEVVLDVVEVGVVVDTVTLARAGEELSRSIASLATPAMPRDSIAALQILRLRPLLQARSAVIMWTTARPLHRQTRRRYRTDALFAHTLRFPSRSTKQTAT